MVYESATSGYLTGERAETLTDRDMAVVSDVERALADALRLKWWWEQKERSQSYAEPFELIQTFNQPDRSLGFFDFAPLNGGELRLMGLVQEILFDQPKQADPRKVRDELREMILRYFMRVSDFRQPAAFVKSGEGARSESRPWLNFLNWRPPEEDSRVGFGYSQLYYKLRATGEVGKFPRHERFAIVDLRELGEKYEWIVCEVRIFNFDLTFNPFGAESVGLHFPFKEATYIALSRDFITCHDDPRPDLLGAYGFGYALLRPAPKKTIFAYGPGNFVAGFQLINFEIDRSGRSRALLAFVANRPDKVISIDIDPVELSFKLADLVSFGWASRLFGPMKGLLERFSPRLEGFDPVTTWIALANLMTGGLAGEQWCVSLKALEKNPMLVTHYLQHYQMLVGALMTWRHVQNWLDTANLPRYAITGVNP